MWSFIHRLGATARMLLVASVLSSIGGDFTLANPIDTNALSSRSAGALTTIYEFPNNTWVENLAVRSNGDILVTLFIPSPDLYQINPASGFAELIHTFSRVEGITGITEFEPDVFAVLGGTFNLTTGQSTRGSWTMWSVNMSSTPATITEIVKFEDATLLNGATTVNCTTVLAADSINGVIYSVNPLTRTYSTALSNPLLAAPANSSIPLGVNGIQYGYGRLYFTNTARNIVGYYNHYAESGEWSAEPTVFVNETGTGLPGIFDDFALQSNALTEYENGYFVRATANTILKIAASGAQEIIAGNPNSDAIADGTSAKLGRTPATANTLYITTNGGLGDSTHRFPVKGGQVLALNLGF